MAELWQFALAHIKLLSMTIKQTSESRVYDIISGFNKDMRITEIKLLYI